MVVAKNIGRLGNNLFQVAASIGYAKRYNYQWSADESNGHGEPYSAIHKVFPNLPKTKFSGGVRYHEHPHGICEQHGRHYDLCHFHYHDIPDMGPNVSLTGFFQSWKYFEHCKEEVKEVFKLPHVEGYEDYCSLHIRLGDYIQHSGSFPPLTHDYIITSVCRIFDLCGVNKFLVFSDDVDKVKSDYLLPGMITSQSKKTLQTISSSIEIKFFDESDELKSLSTMSSCGHHIIANSSFSWWASYLGHNPNRIVISPSAETWFGPTAGVKEPVNDLILPEWEQIPTR